VLRVRALAFAMERVHVVIGDCPVVVETVFHGQFETICVALPCPKFPIHSPTVARMGIIVRDNVRVIGGKFANV